MLSALSALRQSRPPEEVIVLCDGCTDGTAQAMLALGDERVRALELPKGPGYAYDHRNRALEVARGTVVIWLADDDLLLPDHLERIGEYWDADVADVVTTPAAIVHPDDSMEWIGRDWSVASNRDLMLHLNTNVMASVSVRVEVAAAVGGWDGGQPRSGDWDLWKRVLAAGSRAAMTSEPTVMHFRATGREQEWELRIRQNTSWLERISDPVRLGELRRSLRRLGAEHDAAQLTHIRELEERCRTLESEFAQREASRAELAAQLERSLELERQARALAAELESQNRGLRAELDHLYAGGWWRLRMRLLPLMRLVGRGE